jgi:hypothetical protein
VLIEESRPLSATKRWRLVDIVQRAGDHAPASEIVSEEAATSEAIHSAAHPGRHRDERAGTGADDTAEARAAADEGAVTTAADEGIDDDRSGEPEGSTR